MVAQEQWIGKSVGTEIDFGLEGIDDGQVSGSVRDKERQGERKRQGERERQDIERV